MTHLTYRHPSQLKEGVDKSNKKNIKANPLNSNRMGQNLKSDGTKIKCVSCARARAVGRKKLTPNKEKS